MTAVGEKIIKELQEHLRQRASEVEGWAERPEIDKETLRHKWAVDFLRERGVLREATDSAAEEDRPE